MDLTFISDSKSPAANARFGATAAVTPQKKQCENENLYPAASVVEAATSQSLLDVVCHFGTARTPLKNTVEK